MIKEAASLKHSTFLICSLTDGNKSVVGVGLSVVVLLERRQVQRLFSLSVRLIVHVGLTINETD